MDGQFWITLLKILIFFPFVIALILVIGRFGNKFNLVTSHKYMKVLERLPLSKDNSLFIVKVGDKGYLLSSSVGKTEILKEFSPIELENIRELSVSNLTSMSNSTRDLDFNNNFKTLISKLFHNKSKDD